MSHQHHVYHNPRPATPDDVHVALDHGEIYRTLDAMVGCALHGEGDWKQPQELYLLLLDHDDTQYALLPRPAWDTSREFTANSTNNG